MINLSLSSTGIFDRYSESFALSLNLFLEWCKKQVRWRVKLENWVSVLDSDRLIVLILLLLKYLWFRVHHEYHRDHPNSVSESKIQTIVNLWVLLVLQMRCNKHVMKLIVSWSIMKSWDLLYSFRYLHDAFINFLEVIDILSKLWFVCRHVS